jgi:hypothetical protein
MTPRDLIDLANDLCADDREAAWRAAISRAYYGCFHASAHFLRHAGFEVPQAEQAHGYLWKRLQNCGQWELIAVGRDLSELRSIRNRADYEIEKAIDHRLATAQVLRALRLLDVLEAAEESPETVARITAAIRDYERDVLKEVTWRGGMT